MGLYYCDLSGDITMEYRGDGFTIPLTAVPQGLSHNQLSRQYLAAYSILVHHFRCTHKAREYYVGFALRFIRDRATFSMESGFVDTAIALLKTIDDLNCILGALTDQGHVTRHFLFINYRRDRP